MKKIIDFTSFSKLDELNRWKKEGLARTKRNTKTEVSKSKTFKGFPEDDNENFLPSSVRAEEKNIGGKIEVDLITTVGASSSKMTNAWRKVNVYLASYSKLKELLFGFTEQISKLNKKMNLEFVKLMNDAKTLNWRDFVPGGLADGKGDIDKEKRTPSKDDFKRAMNLYTNWGSGLDFLKNDYRGDSSALEYIDDYAKSLNRNIGHVSYLEYPSHIIVGISEAGVRKHGGFSSWSFGGPLVGSKGEKLMLKDIPKSTYKEHFNPNSAMGNAIFQKAKSETKEGKDLSVSLESFKTLYKLSNMIILIDDTGGSAGEKAIIGRYQSGKGADEGLTAPDKKSLSTKDKIDRAISESTEEEGEEELFDGVYRPWNGLQAYRASGSKILVDKNAIKFLKSKEVTDAFNGNEYNFTGESASWIIPVSIDPKTGEIQY